LVAVIFVGIAFAVALSEGVLDKRWPRQTPPKR
jgi:hypothetical protein